MSDKKPDLSGVPTKGLDGFAKDFLFSGEEEVAVVSGDGQDKKNEQLAKWVEYRMKEFVQRSGSLAEDTMAFYTELMHKRGYDNTEGIFALALMSINLRQAYGNDPRNEQEERQGVAPDVVDKRLKEFDKICYYAQQYYEHNKDD